LFVDIGLYAMLQRRSKQLRKCCCSHMMKMQRIKRRMKW
jgi:hypothetical protein